MPAAPAEQGRRGRSSSRPHAGREPASSCSGRPSPSVSALSLSRTLLKAHLRHFHHRPVDLEQRQRFHPRPSPRWSPCRASERAASRAHADSLDNGCCAAPSGFLLPLSSPQLASYDVGGPAWARHTHIHTHSTFASLRRAAGQDTAASCRTQYCPPSEPASA